MKNIIDQSPKPEPTDTRPGETVASQLELTLPSANRQSAIGNRQSSSRVTRHPSRATWWFSQMRQTVDRATTCSSQPAPVDLQLQTGTTLVGRYAPDSSSSSFSSSSSNPSPQNPQSAIGNHLSAEL